MTTRDTVMAEVAGDAASLVPVGDATALATALDGAIRGRWRRTGRVVEPRSIAGGALHLGRVRGPASRRVRDGEGELMRALVTGATGFVGTQLVRHLRESGDEVYGVDRERDVTDEESMREMFESIRPT